MENQLLNIDDEIKGIQYMDNSTLFRLIPKGLYSVVLAEIDSVESFVGICKAHDVLIQYIITLEWDLQNSEFSVDSSKMHTSLKL